MKCRISVLISVLLIISNFVLFAQDVSAKKELAVFQLGFQKWRMPSSVLSTVDEEIKAVFINMGRFDVIGMSQRLEEGDLNDFVDKIKLYKGENVEIPEEVQMGKAFFTEADMNRLVGSFIVVIPSVSDYILERRDSGDYKVTLKTSVSFFNVEEGRTFAQSFVETDGSDQNAEVAIREAVDGIAMKLTFEVRKVPEFQLKTGILEVNGREIILELGRDLGLKVGDEYVVVSSRVLDSGKMLTRENGLIIINEVSDEVSVGYLVYASPRPQIGDQLRELPRLGLDTTPYLHVALGDPLDLGTTILVGARQSISRGFFGFRPLVGLEVPASATLLAAIPLNLYVGGEYNFYMGRLQFVPQATVGVGGAYLWYLGSDVSEEERFFLTHLGGAANLTLSYLFHKNFKIVLEGGFMYWFSLMSETVFSDSLSFRNYGGPFVGGGVTIKY